MSTEARITIPAGFVAVKPPLHTYPIADLNPPVEWMRFCNACERDERFVANRVCLQGLIGSCTNCGDERIAPFTRTNAEAA